MRRTLIGEYIVVDEAICHGKPTIRGTRILLTDVMAMVTRGWDWRSIRDAWGGKVSQEAIAEATRLAGRAFLDHAEEYVVETVFA